MKPAAVSRFVPRPRKAIVVGMLGAAALLAGCSNTPGSSGSATSSTTTTTVPGATTTTATTSPALSVSAGVYTDVAAGQPGYALVIVPTGAHSLGGVAVYAYPDGRQVGILSFSGTVSSSGSVALDLQRATGSSSATATLSAGGVVTLADCTSVLAGTVALGGENEPTLPTSCAFSAKSASSAHPAPAPTANIAATGAINTGLLGAYLVFRGWQSFAADIAIDSAHTYLAHDAGTGLNWAFVNFTPSANGAAIPTTLAVGMQDGGATGYFYAIPDTSGGSNDGWVMVGQAGVPQCLSSTLLPGAVLSLWGLTNNAQACTTPTATSDFSAAKSQWIEGASAISAVQNSYFLQAASDLSAAIAVGGVATATYQKAVGELQQLASLPETTDTAAQKAEAQSDLGALNSFFATTGLYE